jgi:hypothetical protein
MNIIEKEKGIKGRTKIIGYSPTGHVPKVP